MISRKPKLQRQKKLFKQKGKVLRPNQMNINVAAWGRLIKNIQPSHEPVQHALSDNTMHHHHHHHHQGAASPTINNSAILSSLPVNSASSTPATPGTIYLL